MPVPHRGARDLSRQCFLRIDPLTKQIVDEQPGFVGELDACIGQFGFTPSRACRRAFVHTRIVSNHKTTATDSGSRKWSTKWKSSGGPLPI